MISEDSPLPLMKSANKAVMIGDESEKFLT
jgi:hypothetical protein